MKRGFAALVLFLTMGATAILADTVGDDTTEVRDMAVVADSGTSHAEVDSAESEPAGDVMTWLKEVWSLALTKATVGLLALAIVWFLRKTIGRGAGAVLNMAKLLGRHRSFERRYLSTVAQKYRYLPLFGIKTRVNVSIALRDIYVPLKGVKEGSEAWNYVGDLKDEMLDQEDPAERQPDQDRLERLEYEDRESAGPVEITTLVKREKLLMLLGGPGCGKSTFLGLAAQAFASKQQSSWLGVNKHLIPVCIACRDLDPGLTPTTEDLHKFCLPGLLKSKYPLGFFEQQLADGNCLILIDGLDEVPAVENRRAIAAWIEELAAVYSRNRYIVTSRIMGYEQARLGAGFAHYYVSDFDHDDIQSFTNNWYRVVDTQLKEDTEQVRAEAAKAAQDVIDAIKDDRIKKLAVNPLLLTIICTVHRYAGRLPKSRSTLYKDCVDLLLGSKDDALKIALQLRAEQKLEVLKPIAYYLACRETRNISLEELKREVGHYLPSVAGDSVAVGDFIAEVKNRSGLLVESGQEIFAFSHLTFQEYLTALYVKDQDNGIGLLIAKKDNPHWWEIILLWCSMSDVTPFVNRLLECREDVLLGNLCLAGFCIGDALSLAPKTRRDVCDRLYDYWWHASSVALRPALIAALVASKDENSVERFIKRLNDEDPYVRGRAALALGQRGSEKAIEPLIEHFSDEAASVRRRVAHAVSRIGSEKAIVPLIKRLNHVDRDVRRRVASTLGRIGNEKALEPLVGCFKDEDTDVRWRAADALGRIRSADAIVPLLRLLADDSGFVRGRAALALGRIRSEKVIEPLIKRLSDEDMFARKSAALALGRIGSKKVIEPLIERLNDKDSEVRWHAAKGLGLLGSEEAVKTLVERFSNKYGRERWRAAYALGLIGSEEALKPLIERLGDKVGRVRGHAAEALGRIGNQQAVEPLIELLGDENRFARCRAAEALGRIGNQQAIQPLIKHLNDEYSHMRWRSALALGQIGCVEALEPLNERLNDEHSDVRWRAALAVGQIGSEKAIQPLIELLGDANGSVRWQAAYTLSKLMNQSTAETLLPKIDEKDKAGNYRYFTALHPYLRKHRVYIDELPPEVIERNKFWKENLKTDPIC